MKNGTAEKSNDRQQFNVLVCCRSETPPAFLYPVLNFPINIHRASVFQMAPLCKDLLFIFFPFFLLSRSECGRLPLDRSIGNKRAIISAHSVCSGVAQRSAKARQWGTIGMTGPSILYNSPNYWNK